MNDRKVIINRIYPIICHIDEEHDGEKWDNYKTLEELFKLRSWFLARSDWGYAGMLKAAITKASYIGLDRQALTALLLRVSHDDAGYYQKVNRKIQRDDTNANTFSTAE